MKKVLHITAAMAALVLLAAGTATAGILATETWSAPPALVDWELTHIQGPDPGGTLANGAGFGNPAGALCLDVSVPSQPPTAGTLSTDSGPFLGDFTGQTLQFDFFFDEAAFSTGDGLTLYIDNGGTGAWYYEIDLSGQAANTWATYSVNFIEDAVWTDEGTGADGFSTVAGNITEIGFRINYLDNVAGQKYGVDNMVRLLSIPEPETYAALGFALISICITFRKKITETLAQVGILKA